MTKEEAYEMLYGYIFSCWTGEDRKGCLQALEVLAGHEDEDGK